MKNKTFIFVGLLLCSIGLSACAGAAPGPQTLTDADNGKTIQLRNGDKFLITLAGNPTTGFIWEPVLLANSIVTQVGQAEFTPESNKLGAGGMVTLTFQAVATGEQSLQVIYHRPAESDIAPAKMFNVNLVVK